MEICGGYVIMGLDMQAFLKYSEDFQEMAQEFDKFLEKWMQKQGGILIEKTKERTPVDTGNLRNSWSLGKYQRQGATAQIEVSNSADYASHVEYGTPKRPNWKWANGAQMLTKSLYEMEQTMPSEFDKAFTAFLKEKGIL